MSIEDNKALVYRFYEEVFNQRNLALVDQLFTTNHVFHNPPTTLHGTEEFKQLLSVYITAFPDARFTVEEEYYRLPRCPFHRGRRNCRRGEGGESLYVSWHSSGRIDGHSPNGQAGDGDGDDHQPHRQRQV